MQVRLRGEPSLRARVLMFAMALTVRPLGHVALVRRPWIYLSRLAFEVCLGAARIGEPRPPITPVDATIEVGGATARVRGEWVGEVPQPGAPILYFIHGSGYAICSPRTHRGLANELRRRTGRSALMLRYRKGPEHHFPAAQDDALAGYQWLLDQGHSPSDISIVGDSAGGHLTLGLLAELRSRHLPQPAAAVCFSPLVDGTCNTATATTRGVHDPFMTAATLRRFVGQYLSNADPLDRRMNPALYVSTDQAPVLIQCGGRELLAADARSYAAAAEAAGADCTLEVWQGLFHVFQIAYRVLPEARAALDVVETFLADTSEAQGRSA